MRRPRPGSPVTTSTSSADVVVGGQAEVAAAGPQPVEASREGRRRRGSGRELLGGASRGHQRPADQVGAGEHGLAQEVARSVSSSPSASPSKEATKPARAATPPLMRRRRSGRRARRWYGWTPWTRFTASKASATIRNAKFGAQKYVGRRRAPTRLRRPDTSQDATKPSTVTDSSSSGSRTGRGPGPPAQPRTPRPCVQRSRCSGRAETPTPWRRLPGRRRRGPPRAGVRELQLGRDVDAVERRGVQAEDLLLRLGVTRG